MKRKKKVEDQQEVTGSSMLDQLCLLLPLPPFTPSSSIPSAFSLSLLSPSSLPLRIIWNAPHLKPANSHRRSFDPLTRRMQILVYTFRPRW